MCRVTLTQCLLLTLSKRQVGIVFLVDKVEVFHPMVYQVQRNELGVQGTQTANSSSHYGHHGHQLTNQ